jgi:hypothetical protein
VQQTVGQLVGERLDRLGAMERLVDHDLTDREVTFPVHSRAKAPEDDVKAETSRDLDETCEVVTAIGPGEWLTDLGQLGSLGLADVEDGDRPETD